MHVDDLEAVGRVLGAGLGPRGEAVEEVQLGALGEDAPPDKDVDEEAGGDAEPEGCQKGEVDVGSGRKARGKNEHGRRRLTMPGRSR